MHVNAAMVYYFDKTYISGTLSMTYSGYRAWDFLIRDHSLPEVGGSNSGRDTIIGRVFPSNQATGKGFSAEYAICCKF